MCGYCMLVPGRGFGWHKDVAFGSYLHHGPNNQRHLPGYQPKWGKDLGVETKEKEGTIAFQAHAIGHNSLLPFSGEGSMVCGNHSSVKGYLGEPWSPVPTLGEPE